jgi:hypothetical protein
VYLTLYPPSTPRGLQTAADVSLFEKEARLQCDIVRKGLNNEVYGVVPVYGFEKQGERGTSSDFSPATSSYA